MKEPKFESLFQQELEDLYDAEKQIVLALPKMADAAASEELADAFREHLEETKEQVRRLEKIFKAVGGAPGGGKCEGIEGLLREGERLMSELDKSPVRDTGLIAAAQKVEHYEIAGYGSARSMAEMLGKERAAELLQETLDEEHAADDTLTDIAENIMAETAGGADEELEEEEDEEIEDEEIEEGA